MTNLKINSKSEQTTATYTKDDYRVEITYNVNSEDNIIKDINMSVYNNAMVVIFVILMPIIMVIVD